MQQETKHCREAEYVAWCAAAREEQWSSDLRGFYVSDADGFNPTKSLLLIHVVQ